MSIIWGTYSYNGAPYNGATVQLWDSEAFATSGSYPSFDTPIPEDLAYRIDGPVSTSVDYGTPGSYRFETDHIGDYFVSIEAAGHITWRYGGTDSTVIGGVWLKDGQSNEAATISSGYVFVYDSQTVDLSSKVATSGQAQDAVDYLANISSGSDRSATSALQVTGNSSLVSIDGKLTAGVPVSSLPSITGTVAVTGGATSALQSSANTKLDSIIDPLVRAFDGDTSFRVSGAVSITGEVGVSSLPANAATSAQQTSGNSILASIASSVANTPAGGATSAQQTSGNSLLAQIVTNTGNPTVGGSTSALQSDGNASLAALEDLISSGAFLVNPGALTSAIDSVSVPGVSTAALQTATSGLISTGNAFLSSIDTKVAGAATSALQTSGNDLLAQIIENTSTLSGGAATSALQTSGISALDIIMSNTGRIPAGGSTSALQVSTSGLAIIRNASLASIDAKVTSQATSALQSTGNSTLSTISTIVNSAATSALQTSGNLILSQIAGSVANIPTGGATSALQASSSAVLVSIDGYNLVISSVVDLDYHAARVIPVFGSVFPVSGSVDVDNLPTGLATSAQQTSGNDILASIVSSVANIPAGGATSALQTSGHDLLAQIITNTSTPAGGSATSAFQELGNAYLADLTALIVDGGLSVNVGGHGYGEITTALAGVTATSGSAAIDLGGYDGILDFATTSAAVWASSVTWCNSSSGVFKPLYEGANSIPIIPTITSAAPGRVQLSGLCGRYCKVSSTLTSGAGALTVTLARVI